jgi:DNA-directed RNA polymerase specialized sigma subunit
MKPLIKRFEPMLADRARVYTGKDLQIPPAAINAEFKKQFLKAMETYDPKFGTQLGTHVYSQLRAASRFITTHQNMARIPETRIFNIGDLNRATAVLDSVHDRPPTQGEIAKYMKWRVSDVVKLQKEVRKDLRASKFPMDIYTHRPSASKSSIKLVRDDLEPTDRKVLDALQKKQKIREIAKILKISPSAVSRSKVRISKKLSGYLKNG